MGQLALFEDCLSENEKETVNKALYYAVRENFNRQIDSNWIDDKWTELFKETLKIFQSKNEMPQTSGMAVIAVDDFFTSCVMRGWKEELYKISWLEVGE